MRKIPIKRLREVLRYDLKTGVFRWIKLPNHKATRIKPGDVAGSFDGRYVHITVDNTRFAAHRAAFAIIEGRWPKSVNIDHVDGDGFNNRFKNLRKATRSMNQQNQRCAQRNNSTGLLGVVPVPSRKSPKKFRAQICISGKQRNLGYYLTAAIAHAVYVDAKRKLHEGSTL